MRSVLFSYLGEKKHTLLLWMGIELIFVILLSLYRVPSEYYRYPVLLSTVLVLAGAVFLLLHITGNTGIVNAC